jgi:hypothetical protein
MDNNNLSLKCECCKIYIAKNEEYRNGNLIYCLDCVQSKKMDDNIPEICHIEWNYCENCRNLILEKDFRGPCNIQKKCKEKLDEYINNNEYYRRGYTHLCKNCCTVTYLNKNESIVKCLLE